MYNISISFNYFCQKSIVMKTILILLFCFSFSSNGQVLCSINDTNFEQSLIDLGPPDVILDGFVFTVNIDTVTSLDVSFQNINDLSELNVLLA